MVAHAFDSSAQVEVQGQLELHSGTLSKETLFFKEVYTEFVSVVHSAHAIQIS